MTALDSFATVRPALGVLGAAVADDLYEILCDLPGVSISGEVMSLASMESALDLPWNRASAEVEEQLKLTVIAPRVPLATLLNRISSSYRVIAENDRPRIGGEGRRVALVCYIPPHLAPHHWESIQGRPVALTIEVAAGK